MAVVTKTLRSSGGDYSLMSTWESTEQTTLTDNHILQCYDDWPTGLADECTVAGWVVTSTRYVIIEAAAGSRAGWADDAISGFHLKKSSAGGVLRIDQAYTQVRKIGVASTNNQYTIRVDASVVSPTIRECVTLSDHDTDTGANNFYVVNLAWGAIIRNCLSLSRRGEQANTTNRAFRFGDINSGYTGTIYNCTAVNLGGDSDFVGFYNSATGVRYTIKNCVAYSSAGTSFSTWSGATATNNAGNDTAAPGTSAVDSITTAAFVDYAGGDYHPAAGGALAGAAIDLSADFTDDITGATR